MSFAEYLKARLSEEYRNLLNQEIQAAKKSSEDLKASISPALSDTNRDLRGALDEKLDELRETLQSQLASTEQKMNEHLDRAVQQYLASMEHLDFATLEEQLNALISDIISNIPPPPRKANEDLESLANLARDLDEGKTQSEVLNILLQHISGWVDRTIIFVVKGNQASAWAALGLGPDWDATRVKQIKIDLTKDHLLAKVVESDEAAYGPADAYEHNSGLFLTLGSKLPKSALAFPVHVRGRIAGILYADLQEELSEKRDLPQLLFLASRTAGYAIDILPMKSKPTPVAAGVGSQRHVIRAMQPVEAPEPETIEEQEPEDRQKTVMIPTTLQPVEEEDQKLHEDAKRFARLLVSEIKLYNEAQVSAGREKKDLYDRLRDDIERSRQTYMTRVPEHIHSSTDYFYEELVRTLANGDPSLLGM